MEFGPDTPRGDGQPPLLSTGPGGFSPAVVTSLRRTRPWVRLLGIVGFVSAGFMLAIGLVAGVVGVLTQNLDIGVLVVYSPLALIYVFPSIYLFKYASRIRDFCTSGDPLELELALDAQRAFWKFVGVLTLVSLVLTVVLVVVAVLFGVVAGILSSQA